VEVELVASVTDGYTLVSDTNTMDIGFGPDEAPQPIMMMSRHQEAPRAQSRQALGRSREDFSTKIHLKTDWMANCWAFT
jgi:hypothetical protein